MHGAKMCQFLINDWTKRKKTLGLHIPKIKQTSSKFTNMYCVLPFKKQIDA